MSVHNFGCGRHNSVESGYNLLVSEHLVQSAWVFLSPFCGSRLWVLARSENLVPLKTVLCDGDH